MHARAQGIGTYAIAKANVAQGIRGYAASVTDLDGADIGQVVFNTAAGTEVSVALGADVGIAAAMQAEAAINQDLGHGSRLVYIGIPPNQLALVNHHGPWICSAAAHTQPPVCTRTKSRPALARMAHACAWDRQACGHSRRGPSPGHHGGPGVSLCCARC